MPRRTEPAACPLPRLCRSHSVSTREFVFADKSNPIYIGEVICSPVGQIKRLARQGLLFALPNGFRGKNRCSMAGFPPPTARWQHTGAGWWAGRAVDIVQFATSPHRHATTDRSKDENENTFGNFVSTCEPILILTLPARGLFAAALSLSLSLCPTPPPHSLPASPTPSLFPTENFPLICFFFFWGGGEGNKFLTFGGGLHITVSFFPYLQHKEWFTSTFV